MSRTVTATFGGYNRTQAIAFPEAWQWDYGQILKVNGLNLPEYFEVHFSNNKESGDSSTAIGTDGEVIIPDGYLTTGEKIYAFIYLHETQSDGETEYRIEIPVRKRPKPTHEEPTPEQQSEIEELIAALNGAVARAGEEAEASEASRIAADNAQAAAERAQGAAETAQSEAESAKRDAESAQGAAERAQTAAETAQGKAEDAEDGAEANALKSEGYAVGEQNGTPVESGEDYYHDNAKWYKEQAADSASTATSKAGEASASAADAKDYKDAAAGSASAADGSATSANTDALKAEGYAVGKQGGSDVGSGSPYYHNNASYFATQAGNSATSAGNAQTAAETAQGKAEDAQTAAETAQGLAEDAQEAAEAVLESIPADYTTLSDDVSTLKSDFNEIVDKTEVPEELTLVQNSYISSSGIKPYSGWSRTDYLPVTPGSAIKVVYSGSTALSYSYWFDSSKVQGNRIAINSGTNNIIVPSGAYYIMISGSDANMQLITVYLGDVDFDLKSTLPLTSAMIDQVEDMLDYRTQTDQVVNPTAYLMKLQIPDYYFSRNDTPLTKADIGYLDDKINSIPEGYHFMFVTDTHWNDNAKQSTKLISYVRDRIGAKIVLFGGDILTAHTTAAIAYRWLCDFTFDFKNAFGSNFLPVVGNHDLNGVGDNPSLDYSDLVPIFTQGCDNRFHYCDFYDDRIDAMQSSKGMTDAQVAALKQYFRTCYYVDDIHGKTRFIIYNTGAGDGGSGITTFIDPYITGSYEEMLVMEWVYDVLMHTPTGYNVILSTHIPGDFSWSSGGTSFLSSQRLRFAAVISGFKAKKMVTCDLPSGVTDDGWWGGSTLYFDYREAPDVGVVAVVGGHAHVDTFGRYGFSTTDYDTSHFTSIQGDVNGLAETCYQSSTTYTAGEQFISEVPVILSQHDAYTNNGGPNSHAMELGTVTEQVVDVVTITPDGNIALTRIGAGNDRFLTIT